LQDLGDKVTQTSPLETESNNIKLSIYMQSS